MKQLVFLIIIFNLPGFFLQAKEQTTFSAQAIKEDLYLFEKMILNYHPGLHRYQQQEAFVQGIRDTESTLAPTTSLQDAFLMFTQLAVSVQCGHTFTNPYNQSGAIKSEIIDADNKLPLLLKTLDEKWYVDINASESRDIQRGDELLAINGLAASDLHHKMLAYVASDGSNWNKRYARLEMDGYSTKNWFDILLPLLVAPQGNEYVLTLRSGKGEVSYQTSVRGLSAKNRLQRFITTNPEYGKAREERWHYRMEKPGVGYLRLHSFAVFNMKLDWKKFISDAFVFFGNNNANALILDIRGNSGGMYDVVQWIYHHISKTPFEIDRAQQRSVYSTIPEEHKPYLGTWNPQVFDISQWIQRREAQFNILVDHQTLTVTPTDNAFAGAVYLLIDKHNNSATFQMALELSSHPAVTLIGETNGGNRQGTNGGQMFFLNLPNTGIEIDLPLIGYYPKHHQPNAGLHPDIQVRETFQDWINGVDTVLQKTLQLARERK